MLRETNEEMQEETYGVTKRQKHWETHSKNMGEIARELNPQCTRNACKTQEGHAPRDEKRHKEAYYDFTDFGVGDH